VMWVCGSCRRKYPDGLPHYRVQREERGRTTEEALLCALCMVDIFQRPEKHESPERAPRA